MTLSSSVRRRVRPVGKTLEAMLRWRRLHFADAPPIFGNAKPKSGSHLLFQVLGGLTRIAPYRYVAAEPIRTVSRAGDRRPPEEILRDLRVLPKGVIGWGYLDPTPVNIEFLCRPDRINYFIYRDPRDLLVSQVHFATEMHAEHGMHAYYAALPDFSARLRVAITGIDQDGLKMVGVGQRYAAVLGWRTQSNVLCVRYEDFLQDAQGTLASMIDEIERTGFRIPMERKMALSVLARAIQPSRSRTFRAGVAGGWRQFFTPEHKRLFLDVAGDLLVQLGYEQDNDW